ncbi:hypothetical protein [Mycobacterium sp. HUMS_1102779]|uniref:hypothetical protein n=1 Tax=Mycobacterium sp. HUMS_1102779 TaxID=3383487 RepID=UPI003899AE2F
MLFDPKQTGALKRAVEACGQLNVGFWPGQYNDFIQALSQFMGGPLDSVDAFVTGASVFEESDHEHTVMWIRGDSIGLLAGSGRPDDNDPPEVRGWVRPVQAITHLEFRGAEFYRDPSTRTLQEVRPTVRIHFRDDANVIVEINVAGRPDEFSRDQALAFIEVLEKALAGHPRESTSPEA